MKWTADRTLAINRLAPIISLVALFLNAFLAGGQASAASIDQSLAAAEQAHRDGDYRRAGAELATAAKSLDERTVEQRLRYYDLLANVAVDSSLFLPASQAARQHLALVDQQRAQEGVDAGNARQESLVRLARIERALAGPRRRDDVRSADATKHLAAARRLLETALATTSDRKPDSPWVAQTQLLLAQVLDLLGETQLARTQYSAAGSAASAAIGQLDESSDSTNDWLLGLDVVREAHLSDDRASAAKQASRALELIDDRLTSADVTAADRVQLLIASAACYRQLDDRQAEERQLAAAAQEAGHVDDVDRLELAGAKVRLAELLEAQLDAPHQARVDQVYNEAAELYLDVLNSAKSTDEADHKLDRSLARIRIAQCLLKLQLIYTRQENWPAAIAHAEELLRIRRTALLQGDPTYYRALTALGTLHARAARTARERAAGEVAKFSAARDHAATSRQCLEAATAFWRQYEPRSTDELAISHNYLAEVLRYDGDFQRANTLLEEALPYFASMHDPADLRLGEFHSNRAAVLAALGQFISARQSYDTAIRVCAAEGTDEVRARRRLLAVVHLNQAQMYKSQQQYDVARQKCDLAQQAADAAGFSAADRVPFRLAEAALAIAETEQSARELTAAGQWNDAAEQQVRAALDDAFATLQAVLETSDADSLSPNRAMALHLQALARYLQAGLCGDGEPAYREAASRWQSIADAPSDRDAPGVVVFRVRALNYLAALLLRDVKASRDAARYAADAEKAADWIARGDEQLRAALVRSEQALALSEQVAAYPAAQFQVLLTRAQLLRAQAQIERARAKAQGNDAPTSAAGDAATRDAGVVLYEALKLIETPRGMTIGAEEERAVYFSQFAPAFDLLVDLLVDQGRYVAAIEVAERRRSRTFLDQLRASGVDVYETLSENDRQLAAAEKKIADEYFATLYRIQQLSDDARLAEDLAKLRQLRDARYEAHKQVVSASRAYRQVLADPVQSLWSNADGDQGTAAWVRARIGGHNLALVYYLGSASSYVFVCDPQTGVSVHRLSVSPSQARTLSLAASRRPELAPTDRPLLLGDVASLVNRVLFNIKPEIFLDDRGGSSEPVRRAKYRPEDVPAVTDVLLPAALRERLSQLSARHLLIVPDGALHQLPFEALPLPGDDAYLIDVLPPVVYAPSLAIYDQLVNERQRDGDGTISLLSVADPRYRGPRGDRREPPASYAAEYSELGGSLARLAGSKRESDAVCTAFESALPGEARISALTDQDATETNVRRSLSENNYAYLHFAVHGLVDQRHQNLFGALAFSTPDRPTPADDGFLSLHEIMTLPAPLAGCELAILSACQTNCGPQSPMEAGSTMARAFLCAGARRVVCSHWSVSDEATTELVSRLMGSVAAELARNGGADYARALHDAKMELRKNPATNLPQFWAPFVLIGPPTGSGEASAGLF